MFVRNSALQRTALDPEPSTDAVRFANDGTRAVLERILDDLLRRIDERTLGADDAAEIVRSLRTFCADPPPVSGVRSLRELRDVLDPERFASRARSLAASYARLAGPRVTTRPS
jgi:hypothetical protein